MKNTYRRVQPFVERDLKKKMVLLAGPRQCGKTTLAEQIISSTNGQYYSWDIDRDRRILRDGKMDASKGLWVFDELHKYREWRNWLKGVFDQHRKDHSILVTGSAKLDVYSRGGDSLQGRYFFHRLHPFTLGELLNIQSSENATDFVQISQETPTNAGGVLQDLLSLGGFPEPFLGGSQREADRWRLGYRSRIAREEIRDLENIRDIDRLELLYDRLEQVVGSVLSINSLREDLEVAFETVKHWLSILENLYVCLRLLPFGAPKIKAVKKEQKLYLWDWAMVGDFSARFENLVAIHLRRFEHWCRDIEGKNVELRFYRSTVGHEVDFILLLNGKPWVAVEVKENENNLDRGLKYLLERVKFPYAFQISLKGINDWQPPPINGCKVRIMPAAKFLAQLP